MIIDYAGRRPLLLGGYIFMAGWAIVFMVALSQQVTNFTKWLKWNGVGLCLLCLGCLVAANKSKCPHWFSIGLCGCRLRLAGCLISAWPAFSPISWALELDQVSSLSVFIETCGCCRGLEMCSCSLWKLPELFSHITLRGMRHLLPAVFICFTGACMPLVSQRCAGTVCAVLCVISPYSHLVMVLGGDSCLKSTRFWFVAQLVRTVDQLSYHFTLTLEIDSYIIWLFTCRYREAQFPYLFVSLPTCIFLTESISFHVFGGSAQAVACRCLHSVWLDVRLCLLTWVWRKTGKKRTKLPGSHATWAAHNFLSQSLQCHRVQLIIRYSHSWVLVRITSITNLSQQFILTWKYE